MNSKRQVAKTIVNGRLLKNYGSWMYCNACNSTVGYLCYSSYCYFYFSFTCNCGNQGSFELGIKPESVINNGKDLLLNKHRFCCAIDQARLFSVVDKHIKAYQCEVVCNNCLNIYVSKV